MRRRLVAGAAADVMLAARLSALLQQCGAGIVVGMASRRSEDPTPDLFAVGATKGPPSAERHVDQEAKIVPPSESAPQRHRLPTDLPGALARLDDGEIDHLLTAVTDEAKRRGRLASPIMMPSPSAAEPDVPPPRAKLMHPRRSEVPAGDAVSPLTLGKANAVRAAFAAGVKPSIIARQFGISQSAVKRALAGEGRGRKS